MAENVRIEVDLVTGKLGLECPESSIESILTHLADFLVRQVVPFQVVFRRQERAVFVSPSRLEGIGRP